MTALKHYRHNSTPRHRQEVIRVQQFRNLPCPVLWLSEALGISCIHFGRCQNVWQSPHYRRFWSQDFCVVPSPQISKQHLIFFRQVERHYCCVLSIFLFFRLLASFANRSGVFSFLLYPQER